MSFIAKLFGLKNKDQPETREPTQEQLGRRARERLLAERAARAARNEQDPLSAGTLLGGG